MMRKKVVVLAILLMSSVNVHAISLGECNQWFSKVKEMFSAGGRIKESKEIESEKFYDLVEIDQLEKPTLKERIDNIEKTMERLEKYLSENVLTPKDQYALAFAAFENREGASLKVILKKFPNITEEKLLVDFGLKYSHEYKNSGYKKLEDFYVAIKELKTPYTTPNKKRSEIKLEEIQLLISSKDPNLENLKKFINAGVKESEKHQLVYNAIIANEVEKLKFLLDRYKDLISVESDNEFEYEGFYDFSNATAEVKTIMRDYISHLKAMRIKSEKFYTIFDLSNHFFSINLRLEAYLTENVLTPKDQYALAFSALENFAEKSLSTMLTRFPEIKEEQLIADFNAKYSPLYQNDFKTRSPNIYEDIKRGLVNFTTPCEKIHNDKFLTK